MTSLEDHAAILWRLERLFESEGRLHLVNLSDGEDKFISDILSCKQAITKSCQTGKWMFENNKLRNIRDMDIADLYVVMNNTSLASKVDPELKNSFNLVKGVRNYLAHKGQTFGVDDDNYVQQLAILKHCLQKLNVKESTINEKITNVPENEKKNLQANQRETEVNMKRQLMADMLHFFEDQDVFNIGDYTEELFVKKALTMTEKERIELKVGSLSRNVEFWRLMNPKQFEVIKIFVDLLKKYNISLADTLAIYF